MFWATAFFHLRFLIGSVPSVRVGVRVATLAAKAFPSPTRLFPREAAARRLHFVAHGAGGLARASCRRRAGSAEALVKSRRVRFLCIRRAGAFGDGPFVPPTFLIGSAPSVGVGVKWRRRSK